MNDEYPAYPVYLEDAHYEAGYDKGLADGKLAGFEDGHRVGFDKGYQAGMGEAKEQYAESLYVYDRSLENS